MEEYRGYAKRGGLVKVMGMRGEKDKERGGRLVVFVGLGWCVCVCEREREREITGFSWVGVG